MVISKLGKMYKDFSSKEDVDYGIAFEKYLLEAQKTVGVAKTILYGQIPHDLYIFFECVGITNKDGVVDTSDVNNILNIGHKIIISGTGGIGKSMLMKHCFMNAIANTDLIPVLIELRGINVYERNNVSLIKYIYDVLCNFGFKLEQEYFECYSNAIELVKSNDIEKRDNGIAQLLILWRNSKNEKLSRQIEGAIWKKETNILPGTWR